MLMRPYRPLLSLRGILLSLVSAGLVVGALLMTVMASVAGVAFASLQPDTSLQNANKPSNALQPQLQLPATDRAALPIAGHTAGGTGASKWAATPAPHVRPSGPTATPTIFCDPRWTVVPSPNLGATQNHLTSVSAISADDGWAVGYYRGNTGVDQTVVLHWDGTSWSAEPSPNVGTDSNLLYSVTAVSTNDVWAVGYYRSGSGQFRTLMLHWDGVQWSVVPSPNPSANNYLYGVSAVSANDVWAVGYFSSGVDRTLVLHWDGTSWESVPSPNPSTNLNYLNAVSAVSANDVWAVGYYYDGTTFQWRTLTMHWNGSVWSTVPSPSPGTIHYLRGVSALSADDAWAVGDYVSSGPRQTLVLHWDGVQWSVVPSPNPGTGTENMLRGISAVSANDVWAVGHYGQETLVLHWTGSAWNVVPSANPSTTGNHLYGVSALSADDAWAVGEFYSAGRYQTLIERYDACPPKNTPTSTPAPPSPTITRTATPTITCGFEWRVVPSDNQGTNDNYLYGVSALSANDVWAVGYYDIGDVVYRTSVQHWDGVQWSVVPSPNVGIWDNILTGVSAVSANDVWAVGYYYYGVGGAEFLTLVLHWDGVQWSVVPSPNVGNITNQLHAVWALSSNDVWAVGNYGGRTLVLHWNGESWDVVPSPNVGTNTNRLRGIWATSANDVWVVGDHYNDSTGVLQPLVLRWNGQVWSVVPSPSVDTSYNFLYGVSAASPDDAWAVGAYIDGSGPRRTLVLHWNGQVWSVVPSPNVGTDHNVLAGVWAVSANDVWAVGYYWSGWYRTLVLHWDGVQWSVVPSPNPGSGAHFLYGISAASATDIWAAGNHDVGFVSHTLVERYHNPCLPPTTPTVPVTASPSQTSRPTGTSTGTPTLPAVPTSTPTSCTIQFSDVPHEHTFHPFIRCLACRGILGGYNDGTFRPNNDVTRGQLSKIVANAAGFNEPVEGQSFSDVPPTHAFYEFVERMARRGIISGYNDGTFRPGNSATRGQICKIVANAAGYHEPVGGQSFSDVPPTHTFYEFVERMARRGIISGYNDGTFRPQNNATRGQVSKIVANTFYPGCDTP